MKATNVLLQVPLVRTKSSNSYTFCKTMAVSGLASSCSHMNVIFWWLRRFWVAFVLFLFHCFGLFLNLHWPFFISLTIIWLGALWIWILIDFNTLNWKGHIQISELPCRIKVLENGPSLHKPQFLAVWRNETNRNQDHNLKLYAKMKKPITK